jgi:hypothetical protein
MQSTTILHKLFCVLIYFTYVETFAINLNILNMLKDSQYICVHIISTAVCHVQFSFLIAFAHHSPPKKFYSLFLLLLACAKVYRFVLSQVEVNRTVLSQTVVCKIDAVTCQLSDRVKTIINLGLNLGVKSFKLLTSTLIHGGEKLDLTIRILLESLWHVLKMYTCSLSENQAAIQFTCRLANLHDMYMPSKILLKNAQIVSP